jgi:hypothetical protein
VSGQDPDIRDPRQRALRSLLQKRVDYNADLAVRARKAEGPNVLRFPALRAPAVNTDAIGRGIRRAVASLRVTPAPSDLDQVDLSFLTVPQPLRDLDQNGWDSGTGLFDADQFSGPENGENR